MGYTNSAEPFIGAHLSGSTYTTQNFDPGTGRRATSNFVEYFTNKEIDDAATNSFTSNGDALTAASSTFVPFIDYKVLHGGSSGTFPAEGIGYFRITASNGLIYHYSLPVYQLETVDYSVPLNNDYTLPSIRSSSSFTYGLSGGGVANQPSDFYQVNTPNNILIKSTNANKYAECVRKHQRVALLSQW